MEKAVHRNLLFLVVTALLLASCQIPWPESAEDPYPYPESYTQNKDLTVKPGDSFFDYCNGAWLASHPIPSDPDKNLGAIYEANGVMAERVEQLKSRVPDIGKYYSLMDEMYGHADEAHAYIDAQKAKVTRPETREEAYRAIGRMLLEGVDVLGVSYTCIWEKDKLVGVLIPPVSNTVMPTYKELQEMELHPLTSTKGVGTDIPNLMAEGMGIDHSLLRTYPVLDNYWNDMWNKYSVEDLYNKMLKDAWLLYEAYADEEGLAAYNATRSPETQVTRTKLLFDASARLGYVRSFHLQQQFVPQSLKEKYLGITKEIQKALRKRILAVDWMSETTKQNAVDKLDNYGLHVAFPDTWHTDCIPALADCKSLSEALHLVMAGNARLFTHLIGSNDWFSFVLTQVYADSNGEPVATDLTMVNAFYEPKCNSVIILPAMLLPPIMPEEGVSEACYYAVFSIIGHEFTHGFDNQGSQWNKYGEKQNWWAVADMMAFQDRKENLIRTYNNMELDPSRAPLVFCDGERTQGENIADLGGFLAALDTYNARLDEQGFCGENRREQLRKFYESFAHLWCIQYGEKKFQILQKSDVHAHARLRVNGVVMNTDLWYDLYDVDSKNLLYLPRNRRAYIW